MEDLKRVIYSVKEMTKYNKNNDRFAEWIFHKDYIDIIAYNDYSASWSTLKVSNGIEDKEIILPMFELPIKLSGARKEAELNLIDNGIQLLIKGKELIVDEYPRNKEMRFEQVKELFNNIDDKKPYISKKFNRAMLTDCVETMRTPFEKENKIKINILDKDDPIYIFNDKEKRVIMPL